jgi:hypothetical protein
MNNEVKTELIDAEELRARLSEFALEGPTTHYRRPASLLAVRTKERSEAKRPEPAVHVRDAPHALELPMPQRARTPARGSLEKENRSPLAVLAEDLEPWGALQSAPRIVRSIPTFAPQVVLARRLGGLSRGRLAFAAIAAALVIVAAAAGSAVLYDSPAASPDAVPQRPTSTNAVEASEAPALGKAPRAAVSGPPRAPATPRAAVEALVAGRHREAHALYAGLPAEDAATWGVFTRVLARSAAQMQPAEAAP